jgi:hypothetical protein
MNQENIDPSNGRTIQTKRTQTHRAPFTDITSQTLHKTKPKIDKTEQIEVQKPLGEEERKLMKKLKTMKKSPVKYFR